MPLIEGDLITAKISYMRLKLDHLRSALVCEPRGHDGIVAAFLIPPVSLGCSYGVIFANNIGYLGMCGHGLIGVATTLIELGYMVKNEGENIICFDTSEGIVEARVFVDRGNVSQVTIRNVPSFVYEENVQMFLSIGPIVGDIVYGGNWFFIVDSGKLGIKIDKRNLEQLKDISFEIQAELSEKYTIQLPWKEEIIKVDHIKICDHISSNSSKSFVMCPGKAYDRSPCGTGLSAEMALQYKRGAVSLGQSYFGESIIGSRFEGRLMSTVDVGEFRAVVPEISGKAYIIALNQFVIDQNDPFRLGI